KTAELPKYLTSPSLWAKRAAWHQISDRPATETKGLAPELIALAADAAQTETTRIHALWSLEGMHHCNAELLAALITSPLPDLRREAVRALSSFSLPSAQVAELLQNLVEDENTMVRSQVIRTLGESSEADPLTLELLVRAAKPELPGDGMGGAYERKFERYLARRALEKYPDALRGFLQTPRASQLPAVNRLWAIEVLPKKEKEAAFLTLWPQAKLDTLDETTFVGVAGKLDNREIYALVQPVLHQSAQAKKYVSYALRNEARLQSPAFSTMIARPVSYLFESENPADVDLALDVVGRFKIAEAREKVITVLGPSTPRPTLLLALKALESSPENKTFFKQTVQDEKRDSDTRIFALNKLVQVDSVAGQKALAVWLPELSDPDKIKLAQTLTASRRGAAVVMAVYGKSPTDLALLPPAVTERLAEVNRNDRRSQAMLVAVEKSKEEKKVETKAKIKKYTAIAAKNTGDPSEGKLLFQTCLLCHQVGNDGQNIAPALDGSASRETQALLTAILYPDAAVESGYALYRINKIDGSVVEGYLVGKDDDGTTLAFMGGSKLYIKKADIKNQYFLPNRSFMAKDLIDSYTDKQVADLLSFIRTLK
ncbi:HEAT repeat domain-containing protein, partial [Persicitalea sp.]|uniref:HEAT repeat domain-containing protein n=1 Tax=Persicitalea sp. TaxID=3100273 RepID=UPI0035946D5D